MKLALIGRIAGVVVLTMGLAACVDMTEELAVTSDTTAKATMTMTMGADIYSMMKTADQSGSKDEDKFCAKEGEQLTENADGSATCVASSEGTFDQLKFDEGDSKPTFKVVSPGTVRVAFPTTRMSMPVAMGSKVPQWPIFLVFRQRRATATTSCDVMPGALSTRRTPLTDSSDFIL